MFKEKVVFKVGSFTDFAGNVREVIFCAISKSQEIFPDGKDKPSTVLKSVDLGVSVQSPNDLSAKNTELGKIIAEGKTRKQKSRVGTMFSTNTGFINKLVVEALLEQELEYFKQNPGKYIAGYNKDKQLYCLNPLEYYAKFGI